MKRFTSKPPLVAEIEGEIVGFITLENNGHIDWTYTHKDFQRIGVASALYKSLEEEAKKGRIKRLYVETSYLARPFFEKKGFTIINKNKIERNGQILVNWLMEKYINLEKRETDNEQTIAL